MDKFKVPVSMLSPIIDPAQLGFEDTSELEPLTEIIGQERAVEALEFGLHVKSPGFNLSISGPVGTGKGTLVRQMVKRLAQAASAPSDWCYVNNFQDSSRPCSLSLPAGQGASLKREMAGFIEGLRRDIPLAFESKKYLDAKAKLHDDIDTKKKALFHELTELSRTRGFGFEETSVGFGIVPLKAGKSMTDADMEAMTDEEQRDLSERRKALEGEEAKLFWFPRKEEVVMNRMKISIGTLAIAFGLPLVSAALAQSAPDYGKSEYESNCASCHGLGGKGDGPLSESFRTKAADLTTLAKRNDGVFPAQRVYEIIDGRQEVAAHGPRAMPVWGRDYRSHVPDLTLGDIQIYGLKDAVAHNKLLALVDYLHRLQVK